MKPVLSLSTSWLSQRHTDGHAMLQEVAGLGFEWIELSHGIRVSLVPGILQALKTEVIRVSSVHNFCPLPAGFTAPAPNIYRPSAGDSRERAQWLRHTRRTLDFAQQVGARVVVLHLGDVRFFWLNPVKKYRRYLQECGETFSAAAPEYRALLAKTLARIRQNAARHLACVQGCVDEILPYAAERGIRLGIENRERIEELPLDDGFAELFAGLSQPGVAGYWHDTGHAQLKQRAGVAGHEELLAANARQLLGFHLHDVDAAGRDHQPVGTGTVDFAMVSRFFRPDQTLVLEYSPKVTSEALVASRRVLEPLLPIS